MWSELQSGLQSTKEELRSSMVLHSRLELPMMVQEVLMSQQELKLLHLGIHLL